MIYLLGFLANGLFLSIDEFVILSWTPTTELGEGLKKKKKKKKWTGGALFVTPPPSMRCGPPNVIFFHIFF